MKKIGVTGGIGSGKSTVCRIFGMLGAAVYDSDLEARRLMNSDPELIARITDLFGEAAYENGKLHRSYISGIVFNHPELLEKLNRIVHPAVERDFLQWAERQHAPYVVEESAILFECGADRNMDHTVAVTAPEELRIRRTCTRDGSDAEAVRARIARQSSDEERTARADYVLYADEEQLLIPQILELHNLFTR